MSHFTVLVPADDVNDLEDRLLPFMENCCGTPPYDYMTFYDEEDKLQEKAKEVITADSYTGQQCAGAVGKTMLEHYGEGDFDKFCQEWAGHSRDPLEGRIGYWQNEDSHLIDICPGLCYNPNDLGIIRRTDAKERRADAPVVASEDKRDAKGLQSSGSPTRDEVLPWMRASEAAKEFLDRTEEPRWEVHLLPSMLEEEERREDIRTAAGVEAEAGVRNHPRGVHADVLGAGGTLRNLPRARDGQDLRESQVAGGRPQSPDWESACALVREVQQHLGSARGQFRVAQCSKGVSHKAHVTRRALTQGPKWDWYSIGGRWTGYLQLKQPSTAGAHIVGYGRRGVFGKPQRGPLCCDWAPVSWIDWKGMRDKDFEEALEHFRTFKKCQVEAEAMDVEAHLDEFRADFLELLEREKDWEGTLHEYTKQRLLGEILRREHIFTWGQDDLSELSEEEFILKQKAKALTFAFMDVEGHWVQRGQMGWWALVSDKNEDYDAAFWLFVKRLEESSPNQRIYLVDCHI